MAKKKSKRTVEEKTAAPVVTSLTVNEELEALKVICKEFVQLNQTTRQRIYRYVGTRFGLLEPVGDEIELR